MVKKPSYEELKKRVQELEEKLAGQKMSEEALDVHNILNAIEEGYYEVDLAGNFTYFNQATYRNLGYSRDELMHMNNRDYMAPEAAKRIFIIFNEVYRTGKTIQSLDFEVIRKDGSKRIHEMSVSLLRDKKGDPVGFRGISRDRTDLIQMERALREREESYRQVLELAPDAILIMKVKDHRYLEVNDAFCQMTGYSREEAIGRTALDLNLYPDPDERQRLVEAFRTRGGLTGFEIQIRAKNGTIMEHLISGRPIRFQGENAALIMARDITSLKKVQKELRKSEDKYRLVVENVQEGILITQDGLIRFANPKIKELLGYQTDELIDLPMTRIIHPDYQELVLNYHYQRLAGEPAPEVYEFKMAARDGSAPWVETRSVRIDWEGFPATLSLHADITERKKIEEALR